MRLTSISAVQQWLCVCCARSPWWHNAVLKKAGTAQSVGQGARSTCGRDEKGGESGDYEGGRTESCGALAFVARLSLIWTRMPRSERMIWSNGDLWLRKTKNVFFWLEHACLAQGAIERSLFEARPSCLRLVDVKWIQDFRNICIQVLHTGSL